MAVGDERRGEAIIGELRPQQVGMARERTAETVAEVGGQGRAGVGGGMNLSRGGVAVANGDQNSVACKLGDEFQGGRIVRREGDHADQIVGGCLPAMELSKTGGANLVFCVGATGSIFGRDEGAFEVGKRDGAGHDGTGLAGLGNGAKSANDFIFRSGDDGGKKCGDTGGLQG